MPVIEHIISLIAPHRCLACAAEGSLLCKKCSSALPASISRCYSCQQPSADGVTCRSCGGSSALVSVASATAYDDVAKSLVHKLKFERAQAAVGPMAQLICARITLPVNGIITYVPTANNRVRLRGYDQAARIARAVAQESRLPSYPLLVRTSSARQVGASAERRREQLQGAFRVSTRTVPKSKPIIIIDDVITTGSCKDTA